MITFSLIQSFIHFIHAIYRSIHYSPAIVSPEWGRKGFVVFFNAWWLFTAWRWHSLAKHFKDLDFIIQVQLLYATSCSVGSTGSLQSLVATMSLVHCGAAALILVTLFCSPKHTKIKRSASELELPHACLNYIIKHNVYIKNSDVSHCV